MKQNTYITILALCIVFLGRAQSILNKQETLDKFSFWSNQDWKWYKENIPFLETPNREIDKTYYYRWELVTMHLVYGSPESGYASTEFIDRPWWSGAFGTISCPVGHQLNDFRWLRDPKFLKDYTNFWFKTPGAQLQNYTNWLGDAIWQGYKVHRDFKFTTHLLNDLITDYYGWEKKYFVESEGMFAWDGMHDGMETNINSRQTPQWFDGAPGYRPTLNAYMWSQAQTIINIAKLIDDRETIAEFEAKAHTIKSNFQNKNWDAKRSFFFHRFQNDEITADKQDTIKANSLTYEDGKYKGSVHGRELMGYLPWYFNMIDDTEAFSKAWKFLMDPDYFYADFGPTVLERHDPLFKISEHCCEWSGNSWPFATSQTLKALSNVINNYNTNSEMSKADFQKLFNVFTMTHRKNGKPYIAEAVQPDTGSWSGHDVVGHSEHYYHSSYVDLVISDLIGIKPQANDSIIIQPLIPQDWDYFILEDFQYHGHTMTVLWDKTGKKYNRGQGFQLIANGKTVVSTHAVQEIKAEIPLKISEVIPRRPINYAVNNSNKMYPKAIASFPGILHPITKINDGQFWYLTPTTNQWSNLYSEEKQDWAGVDFGTHRTLNTITVYFVSDTANLKAPQSYTLECWDKNNWREIPNQKRQFKKPKARKGNTIWFDDLTARKIRIVPKPQKGYRIGISELEAWGDARLPVSKVVQEQHLRPKVTASFISEEEKNINGLIDGIVNRNDKWTTFESPNATDWLELNYDEKQDINTAYIYFYSDDRKIQPPREIKLNYWDGNTWKLVKIKKSIPDQVTEHALYILKFDTINSDKIRLYLTPQANKYSGVFEIEFLMK